MTGLQTIPPAPGVPADSPLGRLRAAHAERQARREDRDIDVPGFPGLVARLGPIGDGDAALAAIRVAVSTVGGKDTDRDVVDDAIQVIAAGVASLHARDGDRLEAIVDEHGRPVRFDAFYGRAVGVDGVSTAAGAVVSAFTGGDPPELDVTGLLVFAMQIAADAAGDAS